VRSERGSPRVERGGSFNNTAAILRAAYRNFNSPGSRYNYLGLRPVLDQPKEGHRES